MRRFYSDEGPLDTLLQIGKAPVWDGDLISKEHRTAFHSLGWVDRCEGWNVITALGEKVIRALKLCRSPDVVVPAPARVATRWVYYLATPYSSHPDGVHSAFSDAIELASRMHHQGAKCIVPIAHGHPISLAGEPIEGDHETWAAINERLMLASDAMLVAMLPGWLDSKGIKHEIEWFQKAGKPIGFLNPDTLLSFGGGCGVADRLIGSGENTQEQNTCSNS